MQKEKTSKDKQFLPAKSANKRREKNYEKKIEETKWHKKKSKMIANYKPNQRQPAPMTPTVCQAKRKSKTEKNERKKNAKEKMKTWPWCEREQDTER